MGMLYNAYREGTPLLITAGQQDRRLRFEEPILWSPLAEIARPWTKWSVEVERVEDLPAAMRRAIQTALTPPTGPVFMSLPLDVQLEVAELDLTPAAPLDVLVRPPREALRRAAEVLLEAKNPAILAGGRVVERDAVDELIARGRATRRAGDRRERHDAWPLGVSAHSPALRSMPAALVARDSPAAARL